MVRLLDHADSEPVQLGAAMALLDRGWGKPAQEMTGAGGGPIIIRTGVIRASDEGEAEGPSVELGEKVP